MEWKGRRQSDNVEDQRGASMGGSPLGRGGFRIPVGGGGRRGGGLGIGGIIVILIICWITGINPLSLLSGELGMDGSGFEQQQTTGNRTPANDETTAFVRTVLAETEDTWNGIFQANGQKYQEPVLVLFSGQVNSACGFASSATGPFYCPGDQKLYLDTNFFKELEKRFEAAGDFAEAYVIAHEVGHHVQNLLGILPKFNQARQRMSEADANRMSVRVELQADCFAGVWGKFTQQKGILDKGDLEEALNAAQQIGDDTLQKRSQGYVVPESFNHGTSAQRARWFKRGFDTGDMKACDTFSGNV
ncbi:neutral zinc metallopeptidase [Neorhizobium galegae]|uniref:KPN_02809 family neutral zinc metallopeptidase n=1 Tax=Neorhizobium galegae TaxID=399 RepID=UPI0006224EDC|nr:neutral zinc metallopeptidase [Neorhizobium galegae]CDZ25369.1 YpfJ protein, zinc metalloprotease superfamily [Neorhizobium galegae bv. officinalis]KAA9387772.1 flagellar biosynthesis protein FlgM [Neorhizobium galegae]KAB1115758.1 zinc metallopeptidase [Neorhizobium galegae]MCM2498311.1 zinc metallopeptidase [Neorhizobium galegae]MCQ1774280.1 zinc metallopeptidase [Neorhizobium galegae]